MLRRLPPLARSRRGLGGALDKGAKPAHQLANRPNVNSELSSAFCVGDNIVSSPTKCMEARAVFWEGWWSKGAQQTELLNSKLEGLRAKALETVGELPPLKAKDVFGASRYFSRFTGIGVDGVAPKKVADLPLDGVTELA